MLYLVKGVTAATKTSGEVFDMSVSFLVKAEAVHMSSGCVNVGGIEVMQSSLTPYDGQSVEQETYMQFAKQVADAQLAVNEHIAKASNVDADVSLCQLFADKGTMMLAEMRIALSNQRISETVRNEQVGELWLRVRRAKEECKKLRSKNVITLSRTRVGVSTKA